MYPMNMAQNPICRKNHLKLPTFKYGSARKTTTEMMNINVPWKISPNMTPNWNGKVMQLKSVGLISLYLGTP